MNVSSLSIKAWLVQNQALVDREGTYILLSASHSTRVSTTTTVISSPFYMSMDETDIIAICKNMYWYPRILFLGCHPM